MVETISGVGSGGVMDAARMSQASAAQVDVQNVEALSEVAQHRSPSTRVDPTTGILIMEYYSSEGNLEKQIPSEAVMAYLRSGLTEAGLVPPDEVAQADKSAIEIMQERQAEAVVASPAPEVVGAGQGEAGDIMA